MPRSIMLAATFAFSLSRADRPVFREFPVDDGERTLLPASLSEYPLTTLPAELKDIPYWPPPPTTEGARLLPLRTERAVIPTGV